MGSSTLSVGSQLQGGKYRILEVLGKGGFGITYLAEQANLGRWVAVKEFFMANLCNRDGNTSMVSVPSVGSREQVDRFRMKFVKEARMIASLNHPNIIRIHDVFEENGTAYYVMDYLPGGSVSDIMAKVGNLSLDASLRYAKQVASALDYLHNRPNPLNHLDVKPSNIMLDDSGDAVLVDFGLSKRYDAAGQQTSSTPVGVSHGYAPMEQYKDGGVKDFSPTTDIYSLGATLYKMLTGATPPHANDIFESGLPDMGSLVPVDIKAAIAKAMQPRRVDRPQCVKEFVALLGGDAQSDDYVADCEGGEITELDKTVADDSVAEDGIVPSYVQVRPKEIGQITWFNSTNHDAGPEEKSVYRRRAIKYTLGAFAILVLLVLWILNGGLVLPILFSISTIFGWIGLIAGNRFFGTDYFVGTEGYSEIKFKKSRDNIVSNKCHRFDEGTFVFHKETKIYRDGEYSCNEYEYKLLGYSSNGNIKIVDSASGGYDAHNKNDGVEPKMWNQVENHYNSVTLKQALAELNAGRPVRFYMFDKYVSRVKILVEIFPDGININGESFKRDDIKLIRINNGEIKICAEEPASSKYGNAKEHISTLSLCSILNNGAFLTILSAFYKDLVKNF